MREWALQPDESNPCATPTYAANMLIFQGFYSRLDSHGAVRGQSSGGVRTAVSRAIARAVDRATSHLRCPGAAG